MVASIQNQFHIWYTWLRDLWSKGNELTRRHEQQIFWISGLLYKIALDVMYVWGVSPIYSYAGLTYNPSSVRYILSSVFYVLLFAYLPKKEYSAPYFLLHLQFVYILAPMLTLYALTDYSKANSTLYISFVFLCAMLQIYIVRRPSNGRIVAITGIQNYVSVALGILALCTVLIPVLCNGFMFFEYFDVHNINFVYQIRDNATYPPGYGYIAGWMAKAIIPFALLVFLEHKRYLFAGLVAGIQILLYMETGHKLYLFILAPILFVYLCSKTGHLLKLMYVGLVVLCFSATLFYRLDMQGSQLGILLMMMVGVRALFVPADNKFLFYECFSQYPKILFSDGQVGKLFGLTNLYNTSNGQIAFAFDMGEFSSNSCTGYWGEAYSQLGFLGVFLMAILFAFIIRGLSPYSKKEHYSIIAGLFSVYIIISSDNALFTLLLSGGMLLAYLLILIYFGEARKGVSHGVQRL